MTRASVLLAFLLITPFAFSREAPVTQKSPTTEVSTVRTQDEAVARRDTAIRAARTQFVRDLTELKKLAIKADNFDLASDLASAITEAERDLRASAGSAPNARTNRLQVQANEDWQRTIPVKKGEILSIKASGQWCMNNGTPAETTYGPDGLRADGTSEVHGQYGILIARIGFKVFFVGAETTLTAPQDGFLEFRSNDFNLGDNSGALTVSIARD